MKFFGLIVLFLAFIAIGYYIKRRYEKRVRLFKDVLMFCDILIPNINYARMTLSKIIENNSDNFGKDFNKVLADFLENIDDLADFKLEFNYLKRSETENIMILLKSLGKTDIESQLNLINSTKPLIYKQYELAMEDERKIGSLGFKLCICLGLVSVVLLI